MASESENASIQRQIDENLKRVFQSKVEEDLPDRFKELLQQLKKREAEGGSST